jgi:hypothetical protein
MPHAARRATALIGLTAAALALAACSINTHPAKANGAAAVSMVPRRILPAPGSLVSATQPQANGYLWMLAGTSSMGLFEMDSSTGPHQQRVGDGAAHFGGRTSWRHRPGPGTARAGAGTPVSIGVTKTVPLPRLLARSWWAVTAPCSTCDWWPTTRRDHRESRDGRIQGSVPMPSDAVSVVPDVQGRTVRLEGNGLVDRSPSPGQVVAIQATTRTTRRGQSRSARTPAHSTS